MLVNNAVFNEEWHEGFSVVIHMKEEAPNLAFEFTFTTRDEAEAVKVVIEKMIEAHGIQTVSKVRVEDVYY